MIEVCALCGKRLTGKGEFWAFNDSFSVEVGPDCHRKIVTTGLEGLESGSGRLWDAKYDHEDGTNDTEEVRAWLVRWAPEQDLLELFGESGDYRPAESPNP